MFRPASHAAHAVRPRPRTRKEPGRERSPPPFLLCPRECLDRSLRLIPFVDESGHAPIPSLYESDLEPCSPPWMTVGTTATSLDDRGPEHPRSHHRSPERPRPDPLPGRPSGPRPQESALAPSVPGAAATRSPPWTTVGTAATGIRARTVGPWSGRALIDLSSTAASHRPCPRATLVNPRPHPRDAVTSHCPRGL